MHKIKRRPHHFNVSEGKAHTTSFKGKHTTGTKIVTDEYTLRKASHFKYSEKYTTLKYDENLDRKFNRFQRIKEPINRAECGVKFYEAMAVPAQLYESESCTIHKPGFNVIQTVEMDLLRTVKRCNVFDRIKMKMSGMCNKNFRVMKMSDYRKE
jgi:hypothetical protein